MNMNMNEYEYNNNNLFNPIIPFTYIIFSIIFKVLNDNIYLWETLKKQ